MKRIAGIISLLLALVITLSVGCAPALPSSAPTSTATSTLPATATQTHAPYEIQLITAKVGMSTYVMGVALADFINQTSSWLKCSAIEGVSPSTHVKIMMTEPAKRKNTVFFGSASSLWEAENGKVAGVTDKYSGIRLLTLLGAATDPLVTTKADIQDLQGLAGKKVGLDLKVFTARSTFPELMIGEVVGAGKFSVTNLAPAPGLDALKDGLIDAYIAPATVIKLPDGATASPETASFLQTSKGAHFLSWPAPVVEKITKQMGGIPFYTSTIKAGSFGDAQPKDISAFTSYISWACDAELPDDVAYEIARVVYVNADKFGERVAAGKIITKDTIGLVGISDVSKIHPGAMKFFKEKGLATGIPK